MKASARFLLFFGLIFSLFAFLIVPRAMAQTSPSNEALGTEENVPTNLHNTTQVIMIETMSGILCQLVGVDYLHPDQKCLGVDPQTGKIGFVGNGGGAITAIATGIGYTMTPPISGTQYVAYLKDSYGFTKNAYAQEENKNNDCIGNGTKDGVTENGIGFCGLSPIIGLWIGMRNIVYLIFILVFVVVGIGIMLRLHIDPQTVMTLQNQIPKIIVGILAITFSFAIAGFLIDIMYVAVYLFAAVISSAAGGSGQIHNYNEIITASSPFDAMNKATGGVTTIASNASTALARIVSDIFTGPVRSLNSGDFWQNVIGGLIGAVVGLLAWIIIAIAVIVALIRLWFTLIMSYLNILLDVIFAPWWILAGVVPGSPLGVGAWFRDLVANLSVFPMTIGFMLLADVFMQSFKTNPGTARFTPPLIGGVDPNAIAALIGLGFVLMLPNLLGTMKTALKAPKLDFGPLLGPVAQGGKFVQTAASSPQQIYNRKNEYAMTTNGWQRRSWAGAIFNISRHENKGTNPGAGGGTSGGGNH